MVTIIQQTRKKMVPISPMMYMIRTAFFHFCHVSWLWWEPTRAKIASKSVKMFPQPMIENTIRVIPKHFVFFRASAFGCISFSFNRY